MKLIKKNGHPLTFNAQHNGHDFVVTRVQYRRWEVTGEGFQAHGHSRSAAVKKAANRTDLLKKVEAFCNALIDAVTNAPRYAVLAAAYDAKVAAALEAGQAELSQ